MKNLVPKIITILGVALLSQSLGAIDKIHIKACNVEKYSKCMGTNTNSCISAYKKSISTCRNKYPIEKAMELEREKEFEFIKKYVDCINEKYLKILHVTNEAYEQCTVHLAKVLDENHQNIMKQFKERQKKLRKLEKVIGQ